MTAPVPWRKGPIIAIPPRARSQALKLLVPGLFLLLLAGGSLSQAQESATFVMTRITTAPGANTLSSARFDGTVVLAQPAPAAAVSACNLGTVNSLGFISLLGDLPVAIVLNLQSDPLNLQNTDLFWSGTAAQFQVYRAVNAADILNSANLIQQTGLCSTQDTLSNTPGSILFYKVVPQGTP